MSAVTISQAGDPFASLVTGTQSSATKSTADSGQDRFLRLLVTQLKNQDPLNPLANSELTSQLAQISTVQGIEKLNATLGALAGNFDTGQALQAANLVGRQVLVTGDALELGASGARGAFSLAQPVDRLTVTVTDGSGVVVHNVELGAQPAGTQIFEWDGLADSGARAVDGRYRFSVAATAGGQKAAADTLALGRVDGVGRAGDGSAIVNLGSLGEKPFAEVKRIM
jgi:flagellar basal-body rod modification protein FlgD